MLSETRRGILLQNQSSLAKQVYEAVPCQKRWSISMIHTELGRHHHNVAQTKVKACLHALADAGLVRKFNDGREWQRVDVRPPLAPRAAKTAAKPGTKAPQDEAQQMKEPEASIADRLVRIAGQIKGIGDIVETLAIELAEEADSNEEELTKLRQLKSLLKEI